MAKEKAKANKKAKGGKASAEKKTKKGAEKELTPIQKAQLAKKNGTAKKKPKSKKKVHVFKAPEGTKAFFMKTAVMIDKDGIITDMRATRIKGSLTNENAKTVDMMKWDPDTVRRLLARYSAVAFVRNEARRLPPGVASMVMRLGVQRDTGAMKVAIKDVKFKEGKDGKMKTLDKKDAKYRLLRKPARFLAAAFTKVKDFPTAAELKAMNKEEEDTDDEVLTKKSTGKKAKIDKVKAKKPKDVKATKSKKAAKPEKKAKKKSKK